MNTNLQLATKTARQAKLTSFRFRLRDRTFHTHQELERAFDEARFFATGAGYQSWLTIMLRMYSKFASLYDRGCRVTGIPPISDELILCLKSDLDADRVVHEPSHASHSDPHCIGVAYVIEGSALGAKILQKRLDQKPDFSQEYLSRLTRDSQDRWGRFTAQLDNNSILQDATFEEVLGGAMSVFEAMKLDFAAEFLLADD